MNISFFDDPLVKGLYPLTLTRPAADLRIGISKISDKWKKALSASSIGYKTQPYLQTKFPKTNADLYINGRLLPNTDLVLAFQNLKNGEQLESADGIVLGFKGEDAQSKRIFENDFDSIARPYDVFLKAGDYIRTDMEGMKSANALHPSVTVLGDYPIYLGDGAQVMACTLNATEGPIYIGENSTIMEGSLIRGPFAMCENSVVKMGAKIYKDTVLGPSSVVGGELSNVVFQGFSNKGHDGFLGNAVLGEWCNIGADSNCSNLKNNYDGIKLWNYASSRFEKSEQQFCGLIMGDHSKCGINTMFNTGTVVGVACNLFGSGFPRNFIPDFSWGGSGGFVNHKLDAACKTASLVMPRRHKEFNEVERAILEEVHSITSAWRNWER